jgi:2-C-methyl-D-erythritol 4-phosphate cytidylyltransferase
MSSGWGLLLVGGVGSRVNGRCAKQFLSINGRLLVDWAFTALDSIDGLEGIVVVANGSLFNKTRDIIESIKRNVPSVVYAEGGLERQDSVRMGLEKLPETCSRVWVHDGSRPFPGSSLLKRLHGASMVDDAVIPGLPEKNTLYLVGPDGWVIETVDRKKYVEVQTPQVFSKTLLNKAHKAAFKEGYRGTDCASLVERLGIGVKVVEGDDFNIKVTTAGDLKLAEFYASFLQK